MKEKVIKEVLYKLTDLDPEQTKRVRVVLEMVLEKYDITRRSAEISCKNYSWYDDLNRFCERKRLSGKSERTIQRYRYILLKVLMFVNKPVKDITDADLNNFIETYKKLRHVSNTTLEGTRLCISSFFTWLHERGFIKKNPARGVDPIKIPKKIKRAFSDEELEKIKQSCKTVRDKAIIEFLYTTGVRVSEMIALNRKDIRLNERTVLVFGKGAKEREVYLTDVSYMYLLEYLNSRTDQEEALFVSNKNPHQRLSTAGVRNILKSIERKTGISKIHPHRFRTTCATNLIRKGMPIEEVSQILGHETLDTTRLYALVNKEKVKADHRRYMAA